MPKRRKKIQKSKKQTAKNKSFLPQAIIAIRLLLPVTVFIHPVLAILLSQFFDGIDGQIFFNHGHKWKDYNRLDKVLDYWWYIFIVVYSVLHLPAVFPVLLALFLYRTVGQIIGTTFNTDKAYIFFPNIFEWLFVYTIFLQSFDLSLWVTLALSTITALFVEWSIHHSEIHFASKYIFKKEIKWNK